MSALLANPSSSPVQDIHQFLIHDTDDDDADTASQRSISLSSPTSSPRHSAFHDLALEPDFRDSKSFSKRESHPYTVDTEFGSDADNMSMFSHTIDHGETPDSSAAPSIYEESKGVDSNFLPTYPPPATNRDDRASVSSFASGSSRKARPESLLVNLPSGPIIHGVALVDFNHLVPLFHIYVICNQQIAASLLLVKAADVTRSTVQKAVVVLASKPVFGPIRAKLGVVTTALFNQKDFTDASILAQFADSLELSIRGQLTESGLYMGTSLREFVHVFRQRTLLLVKALMLQKRIMFYGHPVERLCLLQTLDDCGSPLLATRAPTLSQPSSLRTSDRKSMMAFMGLPLDIFGKDAFFQPYLPLQQLDILKETTSWLCGSTNSIVTHQKEIDLLVNIETGAFEFHNPQLERSVALTPADRKWMDDIVTDVNEGWDDQNPTQSLQFKGSDDYLRTKFEEYVSAALSTVKYQDFLAKGEGSGVIITGGSGADSSAAEDFNLLWISEFRKTNAYEVWNRITDPVIFDIVEPRHPCEEKPSVVADIGLRLQEGIQELKLEQQLAPAREAVTRAVSVGSTNFFKAVEGVRDRWAQRSDSTPSVNSGSSTPVEVSKTDLDGTSVPPSQTTSTGSLRPFSLLSRSISPEPTASPAVESSATTPTPAGSPLLPSLASPSKNLASWGAGIGSFLSTRTSRFSIARRASQDVGAAVAAPAPPPESEPTPPVIEVTPIPPLPPPAPEPIIDAKSTPPTVQVVPPVVIVEEEDEKSSPLLTPQRPKGPTINVTSPGGTTPDAEPATPTAATAATAATPRAREAKPSQSVRPGAGLWEDHGGDSDAASDMSYEAESVELAEDDEFNSSVPVKGEAKDNEAAGGKEKEKDGKQSVSLTNSQEDLNDAYSGMAL
ncbi:hypothetical protein H0H81_010551 [Sphagnurus paluster]|uniref:AVL9/DENND6 domain-containing protein n=1 Tax=Sphagnurus paluster TaxID=117069 RepID=A0A9P7K587_9AGAR|nr:hypothetical protein H0H81_010551 [Sphagnurus paluster]